MQELQLKCVEIGFDKEMPQNVGTQITVISKIDDGENNLEYKFIVGRGGIWSTIQQFSDKNTCIWTPVKEGEYIVMVQAREKNGNKPLDYLAKASYTITNEQVDDLKEIDALEVQAKDYDEVSAELSDSHNIYNEKLVDIEPKECMSDEHNSSGKVVSLKDMICNVNNRDLEELIMTQSEVTLDERNMLSGNYEDIKDNIEETVELKNNEICKKPSGIIKNVLIEKEGMMIGDKCSIEVKTIDDDSLLYRFYVKKNGEWIIIRDYTPKNILNYTANEAGEKEFLIQCKRVESDEKFEDYSTIKITVNELEKVEIIDFKCLRKELISGEDITFKVETNSTEKNTLYKFYKISVDGKSSCIQDYSTKNEVTYTEECKGKYRLLCLAKNILSNREYDDRALIVYDVKPYREVKIKRFEAELNSPQATSTDIKLKAEVEGGKKLLYRYKVKGVIEEDTGFIKESEYVWNTKEPGEYEIILYVKDESCSDKYECTDKIDFCIEQRGSKPVKINDVIIDKDKSVIIGQQINIMVNAEGGTHLKYAFKIIKDGKELQKVDYNKSNWMNFIPEKPGNYEVEVMLKDKYSSKAYDAHTFIYLKVMEYYPGEVDYIIMPCKQSYLVGDTIELECIIQNTKDILVRYETKINGHLVEQTEFLMNKKLRFTPKIAGKYTITVYAKNIKCKEEFDSKKEVNVYVAEAAPVINTKIIIDKQAPKINEEVTFNVEKVGGKEVCYEFYLMENNNWKRVQAYSRKDYYSFMPFVAGNYKILVLARSYYKKVSYEDYDEMSFEVKK